MNKKFTTLATSVFVALLVSAFAFTVVGCGGDPEAGAPGSAGSLGPSAPVVLDGAPSASLLQGLIDVAVGNGAPIYVGNLEIPAASTINFKNANITFFGDSKFADAAAGAVVNFSGATITWNDGATFDLVPETAVNTAITILSAEQLEASTTGFFEGDGSGDAVVAGVVSSVPAVAAWPASKVLAVSTASEADIVAANVASGYTLYVIDRLTLGTGATTGGSVVVLGDTTVNATPGDVFGTGAGKIDIKGSLTTGTTAITFAGAVTVPGNATFGGDVITGTGAVTVGGKLTANGKVTLGGDLTVTGPASITGVLAHTAAADVTFNGATTITDVVTPGSNGAFTIKGTGAVTLEAAPDLTYAIVIKSTGGVTLASETATLIAAKLSATKIKIIAESTTGITIKKDVANISLINAQSVEILEGGSIVAGDAPDTVTLTGATLTGATSTGTFEGVAAGLTMGVLAVVTVEAGGEVAIAGDGVLTFADNESNTLVLKAGARISSSATGNMIETGGTAAELKVTVIGPGTNIILASNGSDHTITGTSDSDSGDPIKVGKAGIKNDGDCTDQSAAGAAGSVTAGVGTTVTITGSS